MKKKWIILAVAIAVAIVLLTMCGRKKSSVDGYYIMTTSRAEHALVIDDNTVKYQTNSNNYFPEYQGIVEKTSGGADLYFGRQGESYSDYYEMQDYSPLHVLLSEDGRHLYLSSDNSRWSTDIYDKVSKKEYEDYYNQYLKDE